MKIKYILDMCVRGMKRQSLLFIALLLLIVVGAGLAGWLTLRSVHARQEAINLTIRNHYKEVTLTTEALSTTLGEVRRDNAATAESLGKALGELRRDDAATLESLGKALGELRRENAAQFEAVAKLLGERAAADLDVQRKWSAIAGALYDNEASINAVRNNLTAMEVLQRVKHSPADIDIQKLDTYESLDQNYITFADTSDKIKLPCETDGRTAVIVTLGQSNAANYGTTQYTAHEDVRNFNIYDGKCYAAKDPLLGASNVGGNFATRLGDMLIERKLADRVIVAPIAMGGSTVEQWADEGRFHRRILVLLRRLYDAGIKPTHVLWHQGEGNPGLDDSRGRQYRKNLLEVVSTFRRYQIDAPFFVALTTKCGVYPRAGGENIREGQRSTVNALIGVHLGPDTDTLGDEYRDNERCHFNVNGLIKHATLWVDVLSHISQLTVRR